MTYNRKRKKTIWLLHHDVFFTSIISNWEEVQKILIRMARVLFVNLEYSIFLNFKQGIFNTRELRKNLA